MSGLIKVMTLAHETKPKMGEPCNHCGYCCLTEVCVVGQEITGKTIAPCDLLVSEGDKHHCKLVLNDVPDIKETLGIDTSCCAETQAETINRLMDT